MGRSTLKSAYKMSIMKVFRVIASANVPQMKERVFASPPISEKKFSSEYEVLMILFVMGSKRRKPLQRGPFPSRDLTKTKSYSVLNV